MKNFIFLLVFCFVGFTSLAQAPELMSYQAVIRNGSGTLLSDQPVGVRISILQYSSGGSSVFTERHSATTNKNGLLSLRIGSGTLVSGDFSAINWADGPYFIKIETDPAGGTTYSITNTSQILSVPYALYAKSSGSDSSGWSLNGNTVVANNFLGTTNDQPLKFKVNNLSTGYLGTEGNVFWGISSGNNNTNGYSNVGMGAGALFNNTDKSNLVAIGDSSLYNNQGTSNTALGSKALYSNTTGYNNVANGYQSLFSNTTGYNNVANGYQSLYSDTTGYSNVANGYQSLFSNTSGRLNVANGDKSLYSNTTGISNVANGGASLQSNTTGSGNVANGSLSLLLNTTGNSNVANGFQSLFSNTTGNENVANGNISL